ncbi:LamG domain-containing protein [bacterium]|nr:LamG domain-containing protein [candidate division CSSED10-310 bacterium]
MIMSFTHYQNKTRRTACIGGLALLLCGGVFSSFSANKPFPIAFWNFKSGGLTAGGVNTHQAFKVDDLSGYGNHLYQLVPEIIAPSLVNHETTPPQPDRDHAVHFPVDWWEDRLFAHHSISLSLGEGDFSFSCWVKTDSKQTRNTILDKRSEQNGVTIGYHFVIQEGKPCVQIANGVIGTQNLTYTNYNAKDSVFDGKWHHIAITVDRDNPLHGVKFYVDGVDVGSANMIDNPHGDDPTDRMGNIDNDVPLLVGRHMGMADSDFTGLFDELAIYNQVLSPEFIKVELYEGYTVPMKALWNFDMNNGEDECNFSPEGTFSGTSPVYESDANDYALYCSDNNHFRVTDNSAIDFGTDDFTISFRIKPTYSSSRTWRYIMDKREYSSGTMTGYCVRLKQNSIALGLASGSGTAIYSCSMGTALYDGDWHTVTITVDRDDVSGLKFYFDGNLKGTSNPTDMNYNISNSSDLFVGTSGSIASGFNGYVDRIRLYSQVVPHYVIFSNND